MKVCTKCGVEKELTEFHLAKLGAQGRSARCRPCTAAASREHFVANRDRILDQSRTYKRAIAAKLAAEKAARVAAAGPVTAKTCTVCTESKPLEEFHQSRVGIAGRQAKCKPCRSAEARRYHDGCRDMINARGRTYRELNAEKLRAYGRVRAKRPDLFAAMAKRLRERRVNERQKFKARQAVADAIRTGKLVRANTCAWCKTTEAPRYIAHHHSYEPAFWLDVEFICDRCHARHHAEEKAA